MTHVKPEDQCFFISCKNKKATLILFRGQRVRVCAEHAKRYGSAKEKLG